MAGESDQEERTETASAQRQQRARAEGRAPMSREVGWVVVLAGAAVILANFTPGAVREASGLFTTLLSHTEAIDLATALRLSGYCLLLLAAPIALVALFLGSLSVLLQTGGLMKLSACKPDLSRISPIAGVGRLLGPHNLMEAGKSLAKLIVVGGAGWMSLSGLLPDLFRAMHATPGGLAVTLSRQLTNVMIAMLGAQGAITALDVLRSRISFAASLRMTKQEVRDESRENDGNPQVKGRLRQIRAQRSRKRMMTAVPKATVVVTNPTHYAVALAYDRASGGSPRIVAKGVDEVAARIRKLALESNVPLVANPPLARALFTRPLDSEIPAEHFKAVAEIIAYVWRLKGTGR